MRKMKDSGIEWLGMIPEDWETERLQWHISEIKESNKPEKSRRILSLTNKRGVIPYEEKGAQGNVAKEDYTQYKLAYPGTIVANSMNILIGSVGKCDYFGCVSPVYYVFKPNNGENLEFINYIFQTEQFQKELRRYANGILEIRLRVSSDGILKRKVPFPSIYEQAQIVSTIESSTSKVDALISNVQAQIEKLKAYKQSLITEVVTKGLDPNVPMKDSGVEWIGKIPKHWNMIRFRFIAKITTGNQDTQNADPDGMYPFYVRSPIVERCNNYTFEGKGILMAGDGAGAGRVFHLVNGKYAVHQRVYRFYDFKYMNPVLLKFYLENLFATVMDYGSAKTTVPSVRLPMIQDFPVCVPPEDEQLKMLEVLSEKTNKIDRFIAVKQTKIEKLEQYKRSLIYEYVTGKKEVS